MNETISLRKAEPNDVDAIVALVNAAYRVESFFVIGDRTNAEDVSYHLEKGKFLLLESEGVLQACVYVEVRGERGYFGLLAVNPTAQGKGIGARMVANAEEHCRAAGCREMELLIVDIRPELPPFYQRLGYRETGTQPFEPQSKLKQPCQFVRMAKPL